MLREFQENSRESNRYATLYKRARMPQSVNKLVDLGLDPVFEHRLPRIHQYCKHSTARYDNCLIE